MFQKVDYRLSNKEKCYLLAKFRIGQTTGRKLNAEVVAREMRLPRGANCLRLFQSSGFLIASQTVSYFSRVNAAASVAGKREASQMFHLGMKRIK